MKIFRKNGIIVWMVVLAMLLQIVGPVVSEFAYADGDNAFQVVDERLEEGTVYIDWEFTLDPETKIEGYRYSGNFTLEEPVEKDLIANDEDKTVIGRYTISTKGEVTVNIGQKLYGGETPTDPEDEGNIGETGEPTNTPDL